MSACRRCRPANLRDLLLNDRDDVGWHHAAESAHDPVQEVLEREEARQRDTHEQGGKREKKK